MITSFISRARKDLDILQVLKDEGIDAFHRDRYSDAEIASVLLDLCRVANSGQGSVLNLAVTEEAVRKKILPYVHGYKFDDFKMKISKCIYKKGSTPTMKDRYWQVRVKGYGVRQAGEVMLFHFLGKEKMSKDDIIIREDKCRRGCINPYHISIGSRSELSVNFGK